MRIDIVAVREALRVQNRQLKQTRENAHAFRSSAHFDDCGLQGRGYDAMRRYGGRALVPAIDQMCVCLDAQISANNAYRAALDQHFPGLMTVFDFDKVIEQRDKVQRSINEIEGKAEFLSSFGPLGELAGKNCLDEAQPLRDIVSKLNDKIHSALDFLEETENLYDEVKNSYRSLEAKVNEAVDGWSETGGYNAKYNNRVDSEIGDLPYGMLQNGAGFPPGECTRCVWDALADQGIVFPFDTNGGLNGGVWIAHCIQDENGNPPVYQQPDALETIIAEWDLPVHNIVISMDPAPPYQGPDGPGHVTLIKEMYEKVDENGNVVVYVQYVDNVHGEGEITLAEWYAMFGGANGTDIHINGAAIMGPSRK